MSTAGFSFRDGGATDLERTFAVSERAVFDAAVRQGVFESGREPSDAQIRGDWLRQRGLIEFLAAQPEGRYVVCELDGEAVGYARLVRFDAVEQLTELMVAPDHQGRGIGRALLERCLDGPPAAGAKRLVVAAGAAADLTLYTDFGVLPVAGHWHMRLETERYLAARAVDLEDTEPAGVHVLEPDHALAEWSRLEPAALDHARPLLHSFFARERTCLARLDEASGQATGICWVSADCELGPAVARSAEELVPVVLAALDRAALSQQPEFVSIFVVSSSWQLLSRLRRLGFGVWWPSWIMSSSPLPGLARYAPTRPPHVL